MKEETSESFNSLRKHLVSLRQERERRKSETERPKRSRLSARDRELILEKSDARCHICGGKIDGLWQADHVLAHSRGGHHERENYLASHALCNNYRWDYLPEEFQVILKLGVWARTQIEIATPIGRQIAESYLAKEQKRATRRKAMKP